MCLVADVDRRWGWHLCVSWGSHHLIQFIQHLSHIAWPVQVTTLTVASSCHCGCTLSGCRTLSHSHFMYTNISITFVYFWPVLWVIYTCYVIILLTSTCDQYCSCVVSSRRNVCEVWEYAACRYVNWLSVYLCDVTLDCTSKCLCLMFYLWSSSESGVKGLVVLMT